MAENPRAGAILDYFLKGTSPEPLVVEILDAKGALVRRYASDDVKPSPPDVQRIQVTPDWLVNIGYAYTEATITGFKNAPCCFGASCRA